jgi:hypothetical protein
MSHFKREPLEQQLLEVDDVLESLKGVAQVVPDHGGSLPDAREALSVSESRGALFNELLEVLCQAFESLGVALGRLLCLLVPDYFIFQLRRRAFQVGRAFFDPLL